MPVPSDIDNVDSINIAITAIDTALSMMREAWLKSSGDEKTEYRGKLNALLDQRISFMARRNELTKRPKRGKIAAKST